MIPLRVSTNRKMTAVVVPSIRPEAIVQWWRRWQSVFSYAESCAELVIIVVWDMEFCPATSTKMTEAEVIAPQNWVELSWRDIKPEWKDLVPTRCDSVRNLGFLYAATIPEVDTIMTMDDDVFPVDNLWLDRMKHNLSRSVNPYIFHPAPFPTRGCPTLTPVPVLLHHGIWEGVPDVWAKDQREYQPLDGTNTAIKTIPHGQLFPMCGMNLAFRRELLPAMYFWPQDKIRRYGDIWCGLIAKTIIDWVGGAATSGAPAIFHSRLSDRVSNEQFESVGYEANEYLWRQLISFRYSRPEPPHISLFADICTSVVDLSVRINSRHPHQVVPLSAWVSEIRRLST